jgi:hypothetical protein
MIKKDLMGGKNSNTIETVIKNCACGEINYIRHMLYKKRTSLTAGWISIVPSQTPIILTQQRRRKKNTIKL